LDHTRVIVLGSAELTDGFRLIGVETHPDATPETVATLLRQLTDRDQNALVFIEHGLARRAGPALQRVRNEASRIVVTEIPPLNDPGSYKPAVDDLVRSTLGPSALEKPA
jgi:vacuolar-type H+-ATPase subunit F/Vma7